MVKDNNHLFQHISPDDQIFAERMNDICLQVLQTNVYKLTEFLHPNQERLARTIAETFQLTYSSSSSFLDTEYRRGIISPPYFVPEQEDFEISLMSIQFSRKFHQLTHSQILGTLLNRLGIQRKYIGDIFLGEKDTVVCIDTKFKSLLETEITSISRVPIRWQERTDASLPSMVMEGRMKTVLLVNSLRLDSVIAASFQLSRSDAKRLIETSRVKVDYSEIVHSAKNLTVGSLISVRGYGRVRLLDMLGMSKRGKYKIEIELITT